MPSSLRGVPVRHTLVLTVRGKRQAVIHTHPPTPYLHVGTLIRTVGSLGRGKIGNHEEFGAQLGGRGRGGLIRRTLTLAEITTGPLQPLSQFLGLRAPGVGDLARQILYLGPQALGVLEKSSMLDIEFHDGVDGRGGHPTTSQGGLDEVGFTAQLSEVNHASSLVKRVLAPRGASRFSTRELRHRRHQSRRAVPRPARR